jgi:glycosyltransferase involved in cell wall biosynthesis
MTFPKVLIINQPFVNNTGGGITLSNLFSNWKGNKLAVACSGYSLTSDMDFSVCNNYYQLGSEERKWMFPLNIFSRKYYSGKVKFTDSATKNIVKDKAKTRGKIIDKYVYPLLDFVGFSNFMVRTRLSSQFCKWIDEFSPDVIYAQASSLDDILFCLEINRYVKKPFVFHMMDDWLSLLDRKGFLAKYWREMADKKFRILLKNTDVAMSISDYMANEYKRRYAKEFITFHNPITLDFWKKNQRQTYQLKEIPTILYAGRIGLGIDKSLKMIARAVDKVNKEFNQQVKFVIQSTDAPGWIYDFKNVKHQDFVSYENLPKVFAETDVLILPYDFDEESIKFIKYSMPTKAPEYMASGTPIIIFAPEDTALVQYAQRFHWAIIVTENNVDILVDKLVSLLKNKSLRQETALQAKTIAAEKHDTNKVAMDFQNIIFSTVHNSGQHIENVFNN